MADEDRIRLDLFGSDPVLGSAALEAILDRGPGYIAKLLPESTLISGDDRQMGYRLARLCASWGLQTVDHLINLIGSGSSNRFMASKCFHLLTYDHDTAGRLAAYVDTFHFDAARSAIEALGYYGAAEWADLLIRTATLSDDRAQKLGSWVFPALLRMVPRQAEAFVSAALRNVARLLVAARKQDVLRHVLYSENEGDRIFGSLASQPQTV